VTNPDEVAKHGDLLWLAICGENKCSHHDGHMVEHSVGAHYGATLVSLEHRFYGKSHPFPDLQTSNLEFLSSE